MEKQLNQLVEKLQAAAGSNLKCLVLYGSAAADEYQPQHSDLNLLCVVERLDAAALDNLHPVVSWWEGTGGSGPLVFTWEELRRSADIFAIELLDIQSHRRVLYGDDLFAHLEVSLASHRLQVERELKHRLVRLRQRYLASTHTTRSLLALLTASVSTFATLLRHAVIALGEPAPPGKRAAISRAAELLGFDASPFHIVLDVREGERREHEVDVAGTFRSYLQAIERAADEVDRRFAAGA